MRAHATNSNANRLDFSAELLNWPVDFIPTSVCTCKYIVLNLNILRVCSQAYTASSGRTTVRCRTPGGRLRHLTAVAKRSGFPSPTDLCLPAWTAEFRFCTITDEVRVDKLQSCVYVRINYVAVYMFTNIIVRMYWVGQCLIVFGSFAVCRVFVIWIRGKNNRRAAAARLTLRYVGRDLFNLISYPGHGSLSCN